MILWFRCPGTTCTIAELGSDLTGTLCLTDCVAFFTFLLFQFKGKMLLVSQHIQNCAACHVSICVHP